MRWLGLLPPNILCAPKKPCEFDDSLVDGCIKSPLKSGSVLTVAMEFGVGVMMKDGGFEEPEAKMFLQGWGVDIMQW